MEGEREREADTDRNEEEDTATATATDTHTNIHTHSPTHIHTHPYTHTCAETRETCSSWNFVKMRTSTLFFFPRRFVNKNIKIEGGNNLIQTCMCTRVHIFVRKCVNVRQNAGKK